MTSNDAVAPAFDRCTSRQKGFVLAYLQSGGMTAQSMRAAGYKGKYAGNRGSQTLKIAHVREAIRDMALTTLNVELVAQALNTVQYLSVHAESEAVRLRAAEAILDRAKLSVPDAVEHRTPGKVVISFVVPGGGDGTRSVNSGETTGLESSASPLSPIPQPRTIEGSYETVEDDG